jgi:hypothetical protein
VTEISLGQVKFRLTAVGRDGQWVAYAERENAGGRFGVECTGTSAQNALERLERWLEWQHEHAAALEALQQAERAYHRTIGSAFASPENSTNPGGGPSAAEMQQESLSAVDAARVWLDGVRARQPGVV